MPAFASPSVGGLALVKGMRLRALLLLLAMACAGRAVESRGEIERALSLPRQWEGKLWRSLGEVHWQAAGSRFWYSVQTGPATREWVEVEPETGLVKRATTAEGIVRGGSVRDRSGASEVATQLRVVNHRAEAVELFWIDTTGKAKSYGRIEPGQAREQHTFDGHVWQVVDAAGEVLRRFAAGDAAEVVVGPGDRAEPKLQPKEAAVRFERERVIWHDPATGEEKVLMVEGRSVRGPAVWSPNGKAFVAFEVTPAPGHRITEVESSPADQVQSKVRTLEYLKPGDELPKVRPVLFHPEAGSGVRIDSALFPNAFTPDGKLAVRWAPGSEEFYFDYNQRGHQLYRILAVNAETGAVRTVVEETAKTFIDYQEKTWRQWLPGTGELLWMSERDGWCHLWLYDAATGAVKNQVTRGEWVVRHVLRVDEAARQVWFMASGLPEEDEEGALADPYDLHLCRVNLDGSGFTQLTHACGNHTVDFSPDRKFFVDRWSRADLPPVAVLRASEDGRLAASLERAESSDLRKAGWTMPERFVAKGRDGQTDIHGVIVRPADFDPAKKYPVLEEVYAGPHGAFAAKNFGLLPRQHALAELGFVVVQADGMGTNFRGKAFHEVAWQNLQDAGFPDRIAWIKAAAATRPWMDLGRVGIYGGSAGGQNAMRALLDHHDFYRAAFADCGCHDNRMDKIWWNEQWLGWPVGEAYRRASNVEEAGKLEGALMLCVGELDPNVDPASTMQVVNALEKAGKDFELLVITGAGHGAAETPYGSRKRMDFFLRRLR